MAVRSPLQGLVSSGVGCGLACLPFDLAQTPIPPPDCSSVGAALSAVSLRPVPDPPVLIMSTNFTICAGGHRSSQTTPEESPTLKPPDFLPPLHSLCSAPPPRPVNGTRSQQYFCAWARVGTGACAVLHRDAAWVARLAWWPIPADRPGMRELRRLLFHLSTWNHPLWCTASFTPTPSTVEYCASEANRPCCR